MSQIAQKPDSPFDLLAAELIQEVFYQAFLDVDHHARPYYTDVRSLYFPYTALYVSKTWRDLALSAPRLWINPFVRSDAIETKLTTKLRHHAFLSGTLPIRLHVEINMNVSHYFYKVVQKHMGSLDRCKGLSFRIAYHQYVGIQFFLPKVIGREGGFSALETLEVAGRYVVRRREPLAALSQSLPALQWFTIRLTATSQGHEPDNPEGSVIFPRLRGLSLDMFESEQMNWLEGVELPVLEKLLVSASSSSDSLTTAGRLGRPHLQISSTRTLSLMGQLSDERVAQILSGIPDLEELAVSCDADGKLPSYLSDVQVAPKLRKLIIYDSAGIQTPEGRCSILDVVQRRSTVMKAVELVGRSFEGDPVLEGPCRPSGGSPMAVLGLFRYWSFDEYSLV